MAKPTIFLLHLCFFVACGGDDPPGDADADSGGDGDADSDADSDGDGDADSDADADGDVDSDVDLDQEHTHIVTISAEDHAQVARSRWPVTVGVPLPRGEHFDPALIGLADRHSQSRVLSRWRDGSIRFVLLDFQTDLSAGGSASYEVVARQSAPEPISGNSVSEGDGVITVDTGALRFSVSTGRFEHLRELWIGEQQVVFADDQRDHFFDLQENAPARPTVSYAARNLIEGTSREVGNATPCLPGGSRWLRAEGGGNETRVSARDGRYEAAVVEHGPFRTVVRLTGSFGPDDNASEYTIYVHAYRNKPFLRIQHTFEVRGDPQSMNIRRIGLELPLRLGEGVELQTAGREGAQAVGSGVGFLHATGPDDVFHLEHEGFPLDWEAGVDGSTERGITPTGGWINVGGAELGVTASFRDMARRYPKELSFDGATGTLTAWMWPDHGGQVLDLRVSRDADGMEGIAFTHDVLYAFHDGSSEQSGAELAAAFSDPLQPYANPQWYSYLGTQAAGMIMAPDEERFPRTEAFLATRTAFLERSMTEFGWLGMLNYGDIMWAYKYFESGSGLGTWGMSSGNDDCYAGWRRGNTMISSRMLFQYLRTGNHRYFRAAEAHVTFVRDLLIKHHNSESPDWVGLGRRHSAYWGAVEGHPGGVPFDGYGTNWLGQYLHWNLTGDWRTYDAFESVRRAWNRFGSSGGVHQIAGAAYVGLRLLSSIPGYEACADESEGFLENAISHASTDSDAWRDCTWYLGYQLDLADGGNPAIEEALRQWWTNVGGGEDQWGLYWHRDAVAAAYWAAQDDAQMREELYDELLAFGTTENSSGTTMDQMLEIYESHGADGLFDIDLLDLGQAAVPGEWRAKDDLLQIQWDEPLSMAVIDHYERSQ